MQLPSWIVITSLLTATSVGAQTQGQTQTPPPPPPPQTPIQTGANFTVTVSAAEMDAIDHAVHELRDNPGGFIATTVADNILNLANAMVASGRTYEIGPLTPPELIVIDFDALLKKHAVDGGPIRLQLRQWNSTPGTVSYTFTRSSFIAFVADLAHVGIMRVRVVEQLKIIVVGRMIEDLNRQMQFFTPEREILTGILKGFQEMDKRGVISSRVLGIADGLAAGGIVYEFVPNDEQKAFDHLTQMEEGGAFAPALKAQAGKVNVRYGGAIYSASVEHCVFFFIRFTLDDIDLGGKILDYLTWQLQLDVMNAVTAALNAAGNAGPDGIPLGDFYTRGPGLDVVKRAPGILQMPSALGPDYCVLVVSPKEALKRPELQKWLAARAQDLRNKVAKGGS